MSMAVVVEEFVDCGPVGAVAEPGKYVEVVGLGAVAVAVAATAATATAEVPVAKVDGPEVGVGGGASARVIGQSGG